MKFTFYNHTRRKFPAGLIKKLEGVKWDFSQIGKGAEAGEIEISLVSKRKIREVNLAQRGKDKATDVLSFEYDKTGLLGEVMVCPTFKKYAQKDLVFLMVHGVLHVLGFDHLQDKEAEEMEELEREVMKSLK